MHYQALDHAFSVFLMDGTTDAGNQEDELIVLLYCFKDATAQEITPCSLYLSIHSTSLEDSTLTLSAWNDWFNLDTQSDEDYSL